jgi:hypothetical protein
MRAEELRTLLKAQPFRPFTLHTADGHAVPIWHQDFALLSPDGRTLWVYQRDYSCEMFDVMLIPRFSIPSPESDSPTRPTEQPGAA